jgi:hypothetical protein
MTLRSEVEDVECILGSLDEGLISIEFGMTDLNAGIDELSKYV